MFMSSADPRPTAASVSFRSLLKVSLPLAVTQLAQVANGVADTVMAGHLGTVSLAAVAAGAALWLPMMIFLIGLLYVLVPVLGHLRGQGQAGAVAETAAAGVTLALVGGGVIGLLLLAAGPVLRAIGVAPDVIPETEAYLRWIVPGMPGAALFIALRYVLESAGMTGRVTIIALLGAGANAVLNAVLMFGAPGLEPMGVAGCGLATTLVNWGCAAAIAVMVVSGTDRINPVAAMVAARTRGLGRSVAALTVKGLPIGLGFLSDYLVMTVVAMFIATLGAVPVAGHQIAFNVMTVLMMVPLSLSMGGTILLSQARGAGRHGDVGAVIRFTLMLALGVGAILAILAFGSSALVPRLYSPDPAIHAASEPLIRIVAILLPLNVIVVGTGSLLRGLGNMSAPFVIPAAAHWLVSLPLGYALGMAGVLGSPRGALGWWGAFGAGLLIAALVLSLRLSRDARSPSLSP